MEIFSFDPVGTIVVGAGLWWAWKRYVIGAGPSPRQEAYSQYDDRETDARRPADLRENSIAARRPADAPEDSFAARHRAMLDAERRNAAQLAEEIERLR